MNYLEIDDIQNIITNRRIYSNISNLENPSMLRIPNIEKLIRKKWLRDSITIFS